MTRRKEQVNTSGARGHATDPTATSELAPFRERVLAVVKLIPAGQVTNYGTVALLAGKPRAARQVGGILYGLRESEMDVPWQRVINAQGGISTYKVGSGELQMGLAQNNMAYYAYHGEGVKAFEGKPQTRLRGMAMLYPEVIHVLVRKLANIESVADLKGKRVYVGDTGSGTQEDVVNVLGAHDLKLDDLRAAVRGNAGDAVNLLRDDQIDAMFYTVGIGASAITEAAQTAPIDLVEIPEDKAAELHEKYPFYTQITVPGGTYPGVDHDVSTITTQAMMLAAAELSDDDVYTFMDTIFGKNLDKFYNDVQNPNLKEYFKVETALDGMPLPVHPGAIRFFKEQGVAVADDLIPS